MKNNKKSTTRCQTFIFEIAIIIIVAVNMMYMMNFANSKFNQMMEYSQDALFISNDIEATISDELTQELIDFNPNTCKMIEIYSKDFELIFQVLFGCDDDNTHSTLKDHKELIDLFNKNREGQTTIELDDEVQTVYFRWDYGVDGDERLIIIYTANRVVKNLWIFTAIGASTIFLVLILLIRMVYSRYTYSVELYAVVDQKCRDYRM